jgi:hypothetical protein
MANLAFNGKRLLFPGNGGIGGILDFKPPIPEPVYDYVFDGWNNITFDTFSSSGQDVLSAIKASGSYGRAETEYLSFNNGDIIYYQFDATLNTGTYPNNSLQLHLVNEAFGVQSTSNIYPVFNNYEQSFEVLVFDESYKNFALRIQSYPGNYDIDISCGFKIYTK